MRLAGTFTRGAARGTARIGRCRGRFLAPVVPAARGSSGGAARADYNGDGFSDLAVGTPSESVGSVRYAGAVLVIYGSQDGLRTTGAQLLHLGTAGIPGPPREGHGFGQSIAGGDFNLDGNADLAVTTRQPKSLYVMYGSGSGLGISLPQVWTPEQLGLRPAAGDWSLVWGQFGRGAAADLAIGSCCPVDTTTHREVGAVVVLYGATSGGLGADGPQFHSEDTVNRTFTAPEGGRFGAALAAGNLGRGPEDELVVGAPGRDTNTVDGGGAFVLYGGPDGLRGDQQLLGTADSREYAGIGKGPGFGSALAIGDFDGDTIGDLAVGAPAHDDPRGDSYQVDAGAVFIHRGTATGLSDMRTARWQALPEWGDGFGHALAAGDFDGDGRRDLAVGAPFESLTSSETGGNTVYRAGAVGILYGSSIGLPATPRQAIVQGREGVHGTAESQDLFGWTLTAWNWGRGPATDLAVGVPAEDVGTIDSAGVLQVLYGATGGVGFGGQQLLDQSAFGLSIEAFDGFGDSLY